MIIATATQMKNGFGKYLSLALKNGEIYIEKHGKIMAKMIAINDSRTYLSDELKGCTFAPRCRFAGPECFRDEPPLNEIREGHLVRCFHREAAVSLEGALDGKAEAVRTETSCRGGGMFSVV